MSKVSPHLLHLVLACSCLATSFSAAQESSRTAKKAVRDHAEMYPPETGDAATLLGSLFTEAATSRQSLLTEAVAHPRSLPTDQHVAIFTNPATTSVGGLQSCLKEKQSINVRFQTIRVPGAGGGSTREFTRRATSDFLVRFLSTTSEISASGFDDCARNASTSEMTAFSFNDSTCTGYLMTKLSNSCTTEKLIVYIDLESGLEETSYYETDEFMFFTANSTYLQDLSVIFGYPVEDMDACSTLAAELYIDEGFNETVHGFIYYEESCIPTTMWDFLENYDLVGGHEDGAPLLIVMPQAFKRLKYQYFNDICGTTVNDPPTISLVDFKDFGDATGAQVIYSHKGYGFFYLPEASGECVVTFPAPPPGAELVIEMQYALEGGPRDVCDSGDRLRMHTSTESKSLCGDDSVRMATLSDNVVVTLTKEPGYSDLQSEGFVLHYAWRLV